MARCVTALRLLNYITQSQVKFSNYGVLRYPAKGQFYREQASLSGSFQTFLRRLSSTPVYHQEAAQEDGVENEDSDTSGTENIRQTVDLETSIEYMNSEAFKITYGDKLVWEPYKRNFKGPFPPPKTRKTCIRGGKLGTGNPCPICRDEYLLVHHQNVALLKQFVSPYTGKLISYEKTGVCQRQHRKLLVAVEQAWDLGLLEMPLPQKYYNYDDYRPKAESGKERKNAS